MLGYLLLLVAFVRAFVRGRAGLAVENLLLRQQLAVLTRPTRRRARLWPLDGLVCGHARRPTLTPGSGGTSPQAGSRAPSGKSVRYGRLVDRGHRWTPAAPPCERGTRRLRVTGCGRGVARAAAESA